MNCEPTELATAATCLCFDDRTKDSVDILLLALIAGCDLDILLGNPDEDWVFGDPNTGVVFGFQL